MLNGRSTANLENCHSKRKKRRKKAEVCVFSQLWELMVEKKKDDCVGIDTSDHFVLV